ncbi:acyl transferase, partial [Rhodospirillum rubrum]|nr:acyl transferase [Rhodospirillum rubrum]
MNHSMANRLPDIGQSVDRATVGLVFAGNGSQWPGMGAALLRDDAVFRESVSALDAKIRERAGWSVIDALDADTSALTIARIGTAQPLLYALQIGLVDSLRARGLAFGAVCGHSVGEVAAATVVGALDPDQALDLILTRSAAQERTWGQGKMAALALSAIEAEALCAPYDGAVVVAALNSPTSVTLSGDEACLIALGEQAKAAGALFRLLDLDYAFHNRVLDPVRDDLLKALAPLRPRPC